MMLFRGRRRYGHVKSFVEGQEKGEIRLQQLQCYNKFNVQLFSYFKPCATAMVRLAKTCTNAVLY